MELALNSLVMYNCRDFCILDRLARAPPKCALLMPSAITALSYGCSVFSRNVYTNT